MIMAHKFVLFVYIFSTCVTYILSDIKAIDVEPVYKKDSLNVDFEDEAGLAAVPGSFDSQEKKHFFPVDTTAEPKLDFSHAFISSLMVIIVSELGDKTFFIAAIMAMTHKRSTVFAGAMGALTTMHVLSAFFGYVMTYIPRVYTFYTAAVLFLLFGLKMLRDGFKMKDEEAKEEMEEIQMELRKREGDTELKEVLVTGDAKADDSPVALWRSAFVFLRRTFSRVFLEAFTLTFLAEWGDRSQIATVVLAASNDLGGVIFGGLLGHFLCTGLAVLGGKLIASKISVKNVTLIGGVVFIAFGLVGFIMGP